jgi:hypothetical protein
VSDRAEVRSSELLLRLQLLPCTTVVDLSIRGIAANCAIEGEDQLHLLPVTESEDERLRLSTYRVRTGRTDARDDTNDGEAHQEDEDEDGDEQSDRNEHQTDPFGRSYC